MCTALGESWEGLLPYKASLAQLCSAQAFSFHPPNPSSPQTERKSKRDVQRAPQKTLEKQNSTLSFAAFSFLLMFNFPYFLSFIYSSFFKVLFHTYYNPPAFLPHTFPSSGCCGEHPCCRKGGGKSHPMAGAHNGDDEERALGEDQVQTCPLGNGCMPLASRDSETSMHKWTTWRNWSDLQSIFHPLNTFQAPQ